MKKNTFTESDLGTNINELAHETIRELYIASKKVAIYSSSHPLAIKAIGGPFILMEKIFKFKKYFNLHISSGHLYALNIRTKQSAFTDQIMDYMQILDLSDILFRVGITADQLNLFLNRFVKRLPATDYQNLMATHLEKNKIDTIHINSEKGYNLFEKGRQFRGDLADDFSVRSIVGQSFDVDLENLSNILANEYLSHDEFMSRYNIDYYYDLVAYLIPEKIASMSSDSITELLSKHALDVLIGKDNSETPDQTELSKLKNLIVSLNFHPDREKIISGLGDFLVKNNVAKEICSILLPETSLIKIESSEEIDQFLHSVFDNAGSEYELDTFQYLFSRLLRTGQQGKARSVVGKLINYLAGPDLDLRGKALILLREVFASKKKTTGGFLTEYLIARIDEYITEKKETFEFSDLIWALAQLTLSEKDYEQLSSLCDVLTKRITRDGGVWSYESVAVKKSIEELNRREVIVQLVENLVNGSHKDVQYIKKFLITIGSEEVALTLSNIISHESRQVRQNVLKILSEMGKSALNVFSAVMKEDFYFTRDEIKRELPDEKWYIVRNSIFVLGALKDPEACRALELRIGDKDTRVRRSIVEALEKIGGENSADILLMIANDPDREIRQAAIIALAFVGKTDNVPELIDLANKRSNEIINIINTLGKLGGSDARNFLSKLLTSKKQISGFTSGYSSKDELKVAIVKGLGRIGDKDAIDKIKEFNDTLTGTQKIFFGGQKLSKTIDEILSK
jgi:HEAT repeat protein